MRAHVDQNLILKKKKSKAIDEADPIDILVGLRLRQRRSFLGLSQSHIAQATGLTFQQIQKYETGVNRVSASRLHQFSQILNVSILYFFSDQESLRHNEKANTATAPQLPGIVHQPEVLELMEAFSRIADKKTQDAVIHLISTMADWRQRG